VTTLRIRSLSLLLALAAAVGAAGAERLGTPVADPVVTVRPGGGGLPAACDLTVVSRIVTDFLAAFNRGDMNALISTFPTVAAYPYADQPGFQWYSVTDLNGHFVTYDPAELPAYFAARHRHHEHLALLRLEVAASWHPGVDIVYRLTREADDLPPHEMSGKGAVDCAEETIFVWSMAQADSAVTARRATPEP